MTLLRRLGNKQAVAAKIMQYFPPHDIYIEPFFDEKDWYFEFHDFKYDLSPVVK